MASKFYAVRKGHSIGIFGTWDECKKQVHGFGGAEYKSFTSKQQAIDWLGGIQKERVTVADAIAYVDGSYVHSLRKFSYGVVVFYGGEEYTFSQAFSDSELCEMRNVAGEIKGCECAVQFCIDKGIKSVDIYYDYEGIEKWANGSWKANKKGTQEYSAFMAEAKRVVDIHFVKVKGHSGDKYNDMVDALAKSALGIV